VPVLNCAAVSTRVKVLRLAVRIFWCAIICLVALSFGGGLTARVRSCLT